MEEVEDSPDFWSGPVQSYTSPVEHRFLIGLDRSTNGPLPDCDRKYVSVRTMPPGNLANYLNDASTVCNLILWNSFWQISLLPVVVARWGFQHCTQNQNCDILIVCT